MAKKIKILSAVLVIVSLVFIISEVLTVAHVYVAEINNKSKFSEILKGRVTTSQVNFQHEFPLKYTLISSNYTLEIEHIDNWYPGLKFIAKGIDGKDLVILAEGPFGLDCAVFEELFHPSQGQVLTLTYYMCYEDSSSNPYKNARVKLTVINGDGNVIGVEQFDIIIRRNGIYIGLDLI